MSAPEIYHLFHHPIADHSFSGDRQTLAVARDNNIELYTKSGSKFTLKDELKGHDKSVTSVDIAPHTGRIVTCSQGSISKNACMTIPRVNQSTLQTETPTSGNPPPPAGNRRSSSCASTEPPPSCAGRRRRRSSPSARARASSPSATLKRKTTGGCRST